MTFLNLLFFAIPKSQFDFVAYRHKMESTAFLNIASDYTVKFLKLHEPDFIPYNYNANEFYFKGKNKFFNIPLSMFLYIRREKPEIIFMHAFIFPFQLMLLRQFIPAKTKIIVQHHAEKPFTNRIKVWFQKHAYSHVDAYLFCSHELAQPFLDLGIIKDQDKIVEVMEGSGVFIKKDKMIARKILDIPSENVFLWVGRLNANKDPLTVLKAFKDYKNSGAEFRLYMIYGTAEMEPEVKAYIEQNDLLAHTRLVGKIQHEELENWYNAADYFVSGSHYEGSGIALCESMACGCVPIVTKIASFKTMLEYGDCGYLYEPGNANELLQILLNLDKEKLSYYEQRAIEKFEKDLSFDGIGRKIKMVVRQITEK